LHLLKNRYDWLKISAVTAAEQIPDYYEMRLLNLISLLISSSVCLAEELVEVLVITGRSSESTFVKKSINFHLPISSSQINQEQIQESSAMVNLSESLVRVPGLTVQNRQNYAQDLQITSRGFGARSTFGVRGLRLYSDNIPATMPDGQSQTSHFDLASAERIDVVRGPFSALYGNSSGGVISIFTERGKPGLTLSPYAQFGSYGTSHYGTKLSGEQGLINYVASIGRFSTDGYREHSAATRDNANAKIRMALSADSAITLIANRVSMNDVQDPLGLTRIQFQNSPRSVDANAINFNTRKSVDQQQWGVNYEKIIDTFNAVNIMAYFGERNTEQFQAIPTAAQIAATSAGGVIDLSRQYGGTDLRWLHQDVSRNLQWTVGLSFDNLDENRRGFENFIGATLGVKGALRRDEKNNVYNIDQYVQMEWNPHTRWTVLAGIRNSSIYVGSDDSYVRTGNGNDSGSTRYHAANPVVGATFKLTNATNLYASYGKGFETPTLNELSYSANGAAGFNFALQPAKSDHFEIGIKSNPSPNLKTTISVFHIDTKNEITVLSNSGGRSVYQNAGKTQRDGIEVELAGNWRNGMGTQIAYSYMDARYADAFCGRNCSAATRVFAGNRIPGVSRQTLYGEISWHHKPIGFTVALEGKYAAKLYVDDVNSDVAPAYTTANIRFGLEQKSGAWRMQEFARIDNIFDRQYAGSVIVNESNRRFFEAAAGRNYLLGISVGYVW